MGFLDRVRGLFGGGDDAIAASESMPRSESTAALPKEVALGVIRLAIQQGKLPPSTLEAEMGAELGISGTPNYRGDIYSESNVKLIHEQAFGQPGQRTWGEWQKVLMTDPAIHAGTEYIKAQVRDCDVSVEPAPEESGIPKALAQQQADALKANLFDQLEPGWPMLLAQMAEAIVPGFSVHEKVLARNVSGKYLPGGRGVIIAKLAERLPVSIHPYGWKERDGDLFELVQWGMRNDGDKSTWIQDLRLPASSLLLHSWNRKGNNYLGHSAWRAGWYPAKIREQLLKLTGVSLMREGAGVPYAYTDKANVKMASSQRGAIQTFLENMVYHENAAVALPSGWKLEWFFSPGANKGHVVEAYNSLGAIILSQAGLQWMQLGVQSQTGSRAVGETQKEGSDDFVRGVLANIMGVLNGTGLTARPYTGLARTFVQANWGAMPAYPTIKLTPKQRQLDPTSWATGVKTLHDAGAIKVWNHEDENNARERFSLRPTDETEWGAAKAEADKKAADLAEQMKAKAAAGDGGPPKPGEPPAKEKPIAAARGAFFPRRELRPSEQHLALGEMADFLDTSKESFERGAKPIVLQMLSGVRDQLRAALKDGVLDHDEVAALKLDTGDLEAFVARYLKTCRAEGYRQVRAERSKQTGVAMAAGDQPDPSEEWLRLEEALKKKMARDIADRLRRQLEAEAIGGERRGETADQMLSKVMADTVDSKALQSEAGGVVTTAFNMGREQFADEYSDEIESVEASEVLDENTCGPCEDADGEEYDFGSAEYERNTPPRSDCEGGRRCRGIYIFNFRKPGFGAKDEG